MESDNPQFAASCRKILCTMTDNLFFSLPEVFTGLVSLMFYHMFCILYFKTKVLPHGCIKDICPFNYQFIIFVNKTTLFMQSSYQ